KVRLPPKSTRPAMRRSLCMWDDSNRATGYRRVERTPLTVIVTRYGLPVNRDTPSRPSADCHPLDAPGANVYHVSYHVASLPLLRRVLFLRTSHGPAAERCAQIADQHTPDPLRPVT